MHDSIAPPPVGRNPDTVFLLSFLTVSGLTTVNGATPGSVSEAVPPWIAITWAVILTAGAVVTLAGVLWRSEVTGILIEAAGRVALAPTALAYAVAIYGAVGSEGAVPVGLLVGLTVSSAWRLRQIRKRIRWLRVTMREMSREHGDAA